MKSYLVRAAVPALLLLGVGCPDRHPAPPRAENATTPNGVHALGAEAAGGSSPATTAPGPFFAEGEAGRFRFALELDPDPPALGELFSVETTIFDARGVPVDDAVYTLDARMPEHGHGMRTRPEHRPLGEGRYLSEGMRFHMPGRWTLVIEAATEDASDRAEIVFVQAP